MEMTGSPTQTAESGAEGLSPGVEVADWQEAAEAIRVDEAGILEVYVEALKGSQFDCAELVDVHLLADKAQQSLAAG